MKELFFKSLVYAQPHNYSHVLAAPAKASGPAYIRNVEEYIREHAEEPLRVSELASQFGVSVRSLQAGFKMYRQDSVSNFIKDIRLQRAHELLQHSAYRTVTDVAFQCGFNHLSQFIADYKKRF